MATVNKVEKKDYSPVKISYTDKDYTNILDDLINSISGITQKWNTTDANDPGIVLVKLMAILGDMLFYNQDMQSLEVYPNSVTQRKNASSIYRLIGYKMRWFKSATLQANVVNTYNNTAVLPRFCTFTTNGDNITYCTFDEYNLKSNTNNNGFEEPVTLIEGTPVLPLRDSENPYPKAGKDWHTIYGYNYTTDDIVNNRIYLEHQNIDQDHIIVVDDTGETWILKDNIYLTEDVGRFFEFDVDVNDKPYLEIVDYWANFNVHKFKIFYIRSSGVDGQIYANTLKNVTGNVWSRSNGGAGADTYNVSSFIKLTHFDSTIGYNPETPDEARKNSVLFQNTLDTLITLADFERATLREEGVANVRACDLTNDPGIAKTCYVGDINQDGIIDETDYQMLVDFVMTPAEHPLTSYQKRLAHISNSTDPIGDTDIQMFYRYLHPTFYSLGDINMDNVVDAENDLALLHLYLTNPTRAGLTEFQKRLCDMNQDDIVNEIDEYLLKFWLGLILDGQLPKITDESDNEWTCGNITMRTTEQGYEIIDNEDVALLEKYINDPSSTSLTPFQKRLCDVNQDGTVNMYDLELLRFYVKTGHKYELPKISDESDEAIGQCGKLQLSTVETLDGFIVKLYILPTQAYADYPEDAFAEIIIGDLQQYKILPLEIQVDTHSINKYYWTIKGKFITKTPLSRDDLQTIIVNINNTLNYAYSVEKVNFNTLVNYKEIIETILNVDSRILMVDLDPIEYRTEDGEVVPKEMITGEYTKVIPKIDGGTDADKLHYTITLDKITILPGSIMIKVNGGQYILRDNNNGEIYNISNVLQYKGSVNYLTGELDLMFTSPITDDLVITYVHNTTNIALYNNLSTQTFYFDNTSLIPDATQNLI